MSKLYAPRSVRAFWQPWGPWEQGSDQRTRIRRLYVGGHLLAELHETRTVAPHIWGAGTRYGLHFETRQQTTPYYKTARRALSHLVL